MKKYRFILTTLLCLLPLAALADEAKKHTYKVAVDATYAPYEFLGVDGKIKGMLPDMLRAIGQSAGVSFKFIAMPWPVALKSLKGDRVDLINMIRTPERIGKYEFSNPTSSIMQALFRNENETEIRGLDSITGHIIALQRSDIANEKLAGRDDFDRLPVETRAQGLLDVDTGRAAAFFTAKDPGLYFIQKHGLKHVELATAGLWPQDFCFTAKKGNTAIITMLNKGLAEIKHSGRYEEIIRKWQLKPKSWMAKNATQIITAITALFVMALGLWLWVFLLRRTVRRRTAALAEEHALLQQSEGKYRGLLENMPGALLLIHEGIVVYANPAALTLFGIGGPEAATGHPVTDLLPGRCVGFVNGRISQILAAERALPAVEGTLSRADGSEFDAAVTAAPCEYEGHPAVQLIVQDITTRKQAEAETARLLSIIETSADFIGMADAQGRVMYINPAGRRMLDLSADADVSSMQMADFHPPAETKRMRDKIFPDLLKHGGYQTDMVFRRRNEDEILTLATFSVQKNPDGTAASYSVIARDIRKEREGQQRMEHAQRLESLGVLAGGIAHDFNNILTAILGNAALAKSKVVSHPEAMPGYLGNIVTSSEKAAELCRQMLAYSGKGRFVVKALNLSGLVEEITKLLEVSIAKNVVIKYQLAEQIPAVDADAAQMQQVIMNLVINASDAIGEKSGVIAIVTGMMHADHAYLSETCLDENLPEGRYVFLEVSDTGCGMNRETRKRIFEPFFTTKFTGRGLGMSAVLGIIRGHHGALKLYSEPGRGTTFKALFPVSGQMAESMDEEPAGTDAWQGSGSILIVDDEETIRETAAMMLEDMGYKTLTAEDGLEGVEVYRQHQREITVVLLDMTMPRLDGKGCFRELRRVNKDVKVILSSGYNEQEATSHFSGKGLAGFIQKPYHPDALAKAIRAVS